MVLAHYFKEEGREEGEATGFEKGEVVGREKGREEGRREGEAIGLAKAREESRAEIERVTAEKEALQKIVQEYEARNGNQQEE